MKLLSTKPQALGEAMQFHQGGVADHVAPVPGGVLPQPIYEDHGPKTDRYSQERRFAGSCGGFWGPSFLSKHPNPSASVLETCYDTIDYLTSARYVFGTTRFQKEAQENPQHALPFRAGREGPSILTERLKICHEESTQLKRRLSPAVALREPLGLCIRTRVPRELPPSSCPRLSPPGSRHPRPPVLLLAGP